MSSMSCSYINQKSPTTVVCYKKRVRVFLKYVFLPFCAAVAAWAIFNPYLQHHLELLGVLLGLIVVIALPVAFTVQKSDKAEATALKSEIAYVKRIYETNQSDQEKITADERHHRDIRTQLSLFLKRGAEIQEGIKFDNARSFADKESWEKEVSQYLEKELEPSFVHRFQNPSPVNTVVGREQ